MAPFRTQSLRRRIDGVVRLTLNHTRSSSGSCSVAAAAAFTAVRGLAACLAGPVASAAAPATQASTLIILTIANLPQPAHGTVTTIYKEAEICCSLRVQTRRLAKYLFRWFQRSSSDRIRSEWPFVALGCEQLVSLAVPGWCRCAQPSCAPFITRARQTRASKTLTGGTQ